jgi:hypothetical protein
MLTQHCNHVTSNHVDGLTASATYTSDSVSVFCHLTGEPDWTGGGGYSGRDQREAVAPSLQPTTVPHPVL